jgi:hypothetical protein
MTDLPAAVHSPFNDGRFPHLRKLVSTIVQRGTIVLTNLRSRRRFLIVRCHRLNRFQSVDACKAGRFLAASLPAASVRATSRANVPTAFARSVRTVLVLPPPRLARL